MMKANILELFINWCFCKATKRQGAGKSVNFLLFLQKQKNLLLKPRRNPVSSSDAFSLINECWYFVFCWAWGISAESNINLTNWDKITSLFLNKQNKIFKLMASSNGSRGLESWYSLWRQNFSEETKNSNRQEFPLYRETTLNQF